MRETPQRVCIAWILWDFQGPVRVMSSGHTTGQRSNGQGGKYSSGNTCVVFPGGSKKRRVCEAGGITGAETGPREGVEKPKWSQ